MRPCVLRTFGGGASACPPCRARAHTHTHARTHSSPPPTHDQIWALLGQLDPVPGRSGCCGGLPAGGVQLVVWLPPGERAARLPASPSSLPSLPPTHPPSHPPPPLPTRCTHPKFTHNAFPLSFLLILLVSLAMTSLAFLLASLLPKVTLACLPAGRPAGLLACAGMGSRPVSGYHAPSRSPAPSRPPSRPGRRCLPDFSLSSWPGCFSWSLPLASPTGAHA